MYMLHKIIEPQSPALHNHILITAWSSPQPTQGSHLFSWSDSQGRNSMHCDLEKIAAMPTDQQLSVSWLPGWLLFLGCWMSLSRATQLWWMKQVFTLNYVPGQHFVQANWKSLTSLKPQCLHQILLKLSTFGHLMACNIAQGRNGQAGAAKEKKVFLQRETVLNTKAVRKDMQKYSHMAWIIWRSNKSLQNIPQASVNILPGVQTPWIDCNSKSELNGWIQPSS